MGVDLFFVLSGYLIANQLFAGVVSGGQLSLKSFYVRRALRTWPVFWLVLAAYFLFPSAMGGKTPPPLWTFLTFTQNFGLKTGTAFSHAWSLCIEEQFYLVLPLALLLALRIRIPGAYQVALWSYSIYLSHKPIANIVQGYTKQFGMSSATTLLVISVACLIVGAVLYRLV